MSQQWPQSRSVAIPRAYSLAQTAGPAAWVGERSPRHRWHGNAYTWVGIEDGRTVWRKVWQSRPGRLEVRGTADSSRDRQWSIDVLGIDVTVPKFEDPVMAELAATFPGMRPMSDGGLFDGLLTAIIGQSISVMAAAVTQRKLCALFGPGIEIDDRRFYPLPTPLTLAEASTDRIRASGVTGKRAEAIVAAARAQVAGDLPADAWARAHPEETVERLLALPGVGRWTAESTVLWGLGAIDAHPTNDVALLRAARIRYQRPEMTLRELDALAESWRPARSLAARLLWTHLLGPAPIV